MRDSRRRRSTWAFAVVGLLVVTGVSILGAQIASEAPDGFTKVADEHGLDGSGTEHPLADGPVADYRVAAIESDGAARAIAAAIGLTVTFALCISALVLLRRKRTRL